MIFSGQKIAFNQTQVPALGFTPRNVDREGFWNIPQWVHGDALTGVGDGPRDAFEIPDTDGYLLLNYSYGTFSHEDGNVYLDPSGVAAGPDAVDTWIRSQIGKPWYFYSYRWWIRSVSARYKVPGRFEWSWAVVCTPVTELETFRATSNATYREAIPVGESYLDGFYTVTNPYRFDSDGILQSNLPSDSEPYTYTPVSNTFVIKVQDYTDQARLDDALGGNQVTLLSPQETITGTVVTADPTVSIRSGSLGLVPESRNPSVEWLVTQVIPLEAGEWLVDLVRQRA